MTSSPPACTETLLRVSTSANNYDFSGYVPGSLPPVQPISGTFEIQIRFSEPTVKPHNVSRAETLLVLLPGATYNTDYWDLAFQPETYSFVRLAAARGYATLNLARLGDGKSEHPDPTIVQVPLQAALLRSVLCLVRDGAVPGAVGRRFTRIVGLGHSLSSGIMNQVIIDEPDTLDAVVFTGYAHIASGPFPPLPGFVTANNVSPERFGHLADAYYTTPTVDVRRDMFYGPSGTYDPALLEYDDAHKDLVTEREVTTFGMANVTAPDFRGHVLTIAGEHDAVFSRLPGCANVESEGQYYPNAKSVENVIIKDAGHNLNLHLNTPMFFEKVLNWLDRHGF